MTDNTYTVAALHEHRGCVRITELGLEGADRKNPDRPISLMSLDARQQVDAAVQRGLCYRRFTADITLGCEKMPPTGTRLQCGKFTLVILPERKKCWPDCELWQADLPCPLREGVRYARVATPGDLCLGDAFITSQPG